MLRDPDRSEHDPQVDARLRGESQFRQLLDKLPAAAYLCDPEGLITYYNEQALRLWGRAPRLNDPADRYCGSSRMFLPDGSPVAHDEGWMALALRRGEGFNAREVVVERPDGHRITALAHANPYRDEEGRILGAVNVLVDLSDRKRLEEALQEADRSKNEFLATVSHELRTPLNAILGWTHLLRTGKLQPAQAERALETIERNARAQAQLISDLLDISRVISHNMVIDRLLSEPELIVEAACESVRPAVEAKDLTLEIHIDPALPYVLADPLRLQQAVNNLLVNALKFTPRGGRIEVRVEDLPPSWLRIRVSDSGIGIAGEAMKHIFDRFWQADRTTTREHGGLGLGLAIARHLVELHGGVLEADSEGPGKGATFTMLLPAAGAARPRGEPAQAPIRPSEGPSIRGMRILVVDDEEDARSFMRTALEGGGARVETAATAREALAALDGHLADLIFCDLAMPVQDGFEFIGRLRALSPERGGQVPVVALTAYVGAESRERVLAAGFQMHVAKPVDPPLLASIAARIGRRTQPHPAEELSDGSGRSPV